MAVKRKFTFAMSTLLYDGDLILTAAEGQGAFEAKRLAKNLLTTARGIWTSLGEGFVGAGANGGYGDADEGAEYGHPRPAGVVWEFEGFGETGFCR